jgi:transitional endoplasmic reticulum ATPase
MSSYDDFIHISTGPPPPPASHRTSTVSGDFFRNTKGPRQYTEGVIADSLRKHHPKHNLTITPGYVDLLTFANSRDDVTYLPHGDPNQTLTEREFILPARRYGDESAGTFMDHIVFGCYDYVFQGTTFLLYVVEGQDGLYKMQYNYILTEDLTKDISKKKADELIAAGLKWMQELHNEVLVFDQGFWQKSADLWQNVQKSNWEDVILEKEKKKAIIDDVIGFFDAEKRYSEFGVPWKVSHPLPQYTWETKLTVSQRGVIFYGPPGNGKTISTKALMHDISKKTSPKIESLYVKTFNSYMGPEFGIRQIFLEARRMAPCLLIFEDIDSLVLPNVRSYFLNEVDGLESNHGILMIGSTNHLERLDPGIAKRPSRFDRKYFFDVPNREERIQYAEYWRHKLRNNRKIEFPKEMSARVADITGDFSFAYMKEAFVAALLVIVARADDKNTGFRSREDDLSDNILWKELKKQIQSLRKEMDDESDDAEDTSLSVKSGMWPALSGIFDERETRGRPETRGFEMRTRPIDINNVMPRYM